MATKAVLIFSDGILTYRPSNSPIYYGAETMVDVLKQNGFITVVISPEQPLVPITSDYSYVCFYNQAILKQIILQHNITHAFSVSDEGMLFLSYVNEAENLGIAIPKLYTLKCLNDKWYLHQLLNKLNLPNIATYYLRADADFAAIPDDVRLIIKPSRGSGTWPLRPYHYRFFTNKKDLIQYLKHNSVYEQFLLENSQYQFEFGYNLIQEVYPQCQYFTCDLLVHKGKMVSSFVSQQYERDDYFVTGSFCPTLDTFDKNIVTKIIDYLAIDNLIASFDAVQFNGNIYFHDLNIRMGSFALYCFPDWIKQSVLALVTGNINCALLEQELKTAHLMHRLLLPSLDTIHDISNSSDIKVLVNGKTKRKNTNYHARLICSGPTILECFTKVHEFAKASNLYQREPEGLESLLNH